MPFGEGFLPTHTLNHSLRWLYLGRFIFLNFPGTGFTAKMLSYCRRVITDKWCISARSWRSLPNMPCGIASVKILSGRFARNFPDNTLGGTLYLHREVSVFIYARQGQDTFTTTIFLFSLRRKKCIAS